MVEEVTKGTSRTWVLIVAGAALGVIVTLWVTQTDYFDSSKLEQALEIERETLEGRDTTEAEDPDLADSPEQSTPTARGEVFPHPEVSQAYRELLEYVDLWRTGVIYPEVSLEPQPLALALGTGDNFDLLLWNLNDALERNPVSPDSVISENSLRGVLNATYALALLADEFQAAVKSACLPADSETDLVACSEAILYDEPLLAFSEKFERLDDDLRAAIRTVQAEAK